MAIRWLVHMKKRYSRILPGYVLTLLCIGGGCEQAGTDDGADDATPTTDTLGQTSDSANERETGDSAPVTIDLTDITITRSARIPTVAIVEWPKEVCNIDAGRIEEAYIDYGMGSAFEMRAPVDLTASRFRTLLLGMKAGPKTYSVRSTSDTLTFETGWLPTDLPAVEETFRLANSKLARGFYVSIYWASPYAFIIDTDGDYV